MKSNDLTLISNMSLNLGNTDIVCGEVTKLSVWVRFIILRVLHPPAPVPILSV